jgi:hypothetical protein
MSKVAPSPTWRRIGSNDKPMPWRQSVSWLAHAGSTPSTSTAKTAEAAPRRPSSPYKTFSRLQTAHHRRSGCRIISSRPSGRVREMRRGRQHPFFFVRLSAAGLPKQSLLPLQLQLIQTGEHGWVHWKTPSYRLTLALDLVVVRAHASKRKPRYGVIDVLART